MLNKHFGFLVFMMTFLSVICIPVLAGTSDPPKHIHLTWQRDDTAHGVTITWQTYKPDAGDVVLYDTLPRNGNPKLYSYSTRGINHTYPGASGYIHDAELTGLVPNTTYYFICGGERGGWSNERVFRTATISRLNIRFVVGGDCRTNDAERDKISQIMSKFNPEFAVLDGDMVEDGTSQEQWDSFFSSMNAYWVGSIGLTIPIVSTLGNHEGNSTKYYEQFALPGNEQWYSLDWGRDVHIIMLNSEADLDGIVAQTSWLEQDLRDHASYLWKFVVFHRNVFTSDHDEWRSAFDYWVPLFDRYHVDIVFNGHSHNYMRTKPIDWTASNKIPQFSYLNGTMYIVSGGWGAPLHNVAGGWWVAYNRTIYNFVLIDIFQHGALHIQTKDDTGMTFDEVWIYKSQAIFEEQMIENRALTAQIESLQSEIQALHEQVLELERQAQSRLTLILILGAGLFLAVVVFASIQLRHKRGIHDEDDKSQEKVKKEERKV